MNVLQIRVPIGEGASLSIRIDLFGAPAITRDHLKAAQRYIALAFAPSVEMTVDVPAKSAQGPPQ